MRRVREDRYSWKVIAKSMRGRTVASLMLRHSYLTGYVGDIPSLTAENSVNAISRRNNCKRRGLIGKKS
jgi:hypothetical protein